MPIEEARLLDALRYHDLLHGQLAAHFSSFLRESHLNLMIPGQNGRLVQQRIDERGPQLTIGNNVNVLVEQVGFANIVNVHSTGRLLEMNVGWQHAPLQSRLRATREVRDRYIALLIGVHFLYLCRAIAQID